MSDQRVAIDRVELGAVLGMGHREGISRISTHPRMRGLGRTKV
jgi:hypothetical protein